MNNNPTIFDENLKYKDAKLSKKLSFIVAFFNSAKFYLRSLFSKTVEKKIYHIYMGLNLLSPAVTVAIFH
jgi:hypothetical protein